MLPTTGVTNITLGGSDNAVSAYSVTTTSASALAGASTIVVTNVTGFSSTYAIGIELSDSTMQWTTINGAPSGTTVTLSATLTGAVASGAQVYAYSTANRIVRPLRVVNAYSYNVVDTTRFPITIITYDEYNRLGQPNADGVSTQIYYDPHGVPAPNTGTGSLFVYPRFLSGDRLIQIRFHRPYEDFDASTDEPDFPQEWYLPLMLELAALYGPKAGVTKEERSALLPTCYLGNKRNFFFANDLLFSNKFSTC